MERAPNDQQPSSPTIEQIGGDKMLVDFGHNQKLPVWLDESDKMVVFDNGKPSIWNEEAQKVLAFDDRDGKEMLICFILVISVAGVAAGLGAGLSSAHARFSPGSNATSNFGIGGSLDPAYYSKSGAFNGSGFGLIPQTVIGTGNDYGSPVL
ncbi:hypothetical protein KCU78_g2482, partial [Aureobasidium melanogenum]